MKKSHILIGLIALLFLVVIIEAGILLYRKGNLMTRVSDNQTGSNLPVPVPEQEGRQAVYIAETTGLQSASASLVYQGSIKDTSLNSASGIVKVVIDIPEADDNATFYFDEITVPKISYILDEEVKRYASAQELQESLQVGENVRVQFDYNILANTVNTVTISKL